MRVLAILNKKSSKICMILTVVLGLCTIAFVCVPPSTNVGHSVHAARLTKLIAPTRLAYIAAHV